MTTGSSDSLTKQLSALRASLDNYVNPHPLNTGKAQSPASQNEESLAEISLWLAQQIERRMGIQLTGSVKRKLESIILGTEPIELQRWLDTLRSTADPGGEWQSLAEMLTVHETYLFRDPDQLEFFRTHFLVPLIAERSKSVSPQLRLWSAACATGEEIYTLALMILRTLEDQGELTSTMSGQMTFRRPWSIRLLGTDLSRSVVRTAESGIYRDFDMGAFRVIEDYYWRYFQPIDVSAKMGLNNTVEGKVWQVRPELRHLIQFGQFNLLAATPPAEGFDAIFCRNVLIYFGEATKRQVFSLIESALANGGYAVFGPTDVPSSPALKPVWGPATVLYRKID